MIQAAVACARFGSAAIFSTLEKGQITGAKCRHRFQASSPSRWQSESSRVFPVAILNHPAIFPILTAHSRSWVRVSKRLLPWRGVSDAHRACRPRRAPQASATCGTKRLTCLENVALVAGGRCWHTRIRARHRWRRPPRRRIRAPRGRLRRRPRFAGARRRDRRAPSRRTAAFPRRRTVRLDHASEDAARSFELLGTPLFSTCPNRTTRSSRCRNA